VILGIRPEAFEDAAFADPALPTVDVDVLVLEELGSDTHVIFRSTPAGRGRGPARRRRQRGGRARRRRPVALQRAGLLAHRGRTGAPLRLAVEPASLYFFDPDTGASLTSGAQFRRSSPELPLAVVPKPVSASRERSVRRAGLDARVRQPSTPETRRIAMALAACSACRSGVRAGLAGARRRPRLGERGLRADGRRVGVQLVRARTGRPLLRRPDGPPAARRQARPAVRIRDRPRFGWRGAMLDVARHFRPVQDVKRFVDLIALYKSTDLHLHLSDDQGGESRSRSGRGSRRTAARRRSAAGRAATTPSAVLRTSSATRPPVT
jgi:hypothetical protein